MASSRKKGKSYQIIAYCGYDADGKQIKRYKTWTPEPGMTDRQVEKELRRQEVLWDEECLKGYAGTRMKLKEYCEKRYFPEYVSGLKRRTRRCYKDMTPYTYAMLGHLWIDKITPLHIAKFKQKLSILPSKRGDKLSPKTVKNYMSFVSSIFRFAVEVGDVGQNPCVGVRAPKQERVEKKCYTADEIMELLAMIEDEPLKYQVAIYLLAFGGYRRGEVCGFEWSDIHWPQNMVRVRQTSLYAHGEGVFLDSPKTEESYRYNVLPDIVFDKLRALRREQNVNRMACGDRWQGNDRVLTNHYGKPISPNSIYRWLEKVCKREGKRFLGLHAFRHAAASIMIADGVDIKSVSAVLGHRQTTTTVNTYAHEIKEAKARASGVVANALTRRIEQKKVE